MIYKKEKITFSKITYLVFNLKMPEIINKNIE